MHSVSNFHRDGYAIVPDILPDGEVRALQQALENLPQDEAVRRRGDTYGARNLFTLVPAVCELASGPALRNLVAPILGDDCFAVRAMLFDKVDAANWKVGWHQDKFIAVRERLDVPGFGPWSQKAGVWQVIPPVKIMNRMVTLRIHLDDCHAENGPLRVLPGTHRQGWLDGKVSHFRARVEEFRCVADSGSVLMMRPTLLHASSAAVSPSHRRVMHIEYAAEELPGQLDWAHRIMGDTQ